MTMILCPKMSFGEKNSHIPTQLIGVYRIPNFRIRPDPEKTPDIWPDIWPDPDPVHLYQLISPAVNLGCSVLRNNVWKTRRF